MEDGIKEDDESDELMGLAEVVTGTALELLSFVPLAVELSFTRTFPVRPPVWLTLEARWSELADGSRWRERRAEEAGDESKPFTRLLPPSLLSYSTDARYSSARAAIGEM